MLLGQCPLNHFQCKNKRCVQPSRICDGNNDCMDNTDEIDGCAGTIYIKKYVGFKEFKNDNQIFMLLK